MKEHKNAALYILSTALTSMAVGIFSLVFNLRISLIIQDKTFLSNFFLIGNLSMALGGVAVGRIIDKYNKRNVLIIGTMGAAFFFAAESLLGSQVALYFVSVCYGLFFSLLMSIHTPFIMCYAEEKVQPYVISIASSVKIAGFTVGTILAGYIPAICSLSTESIYDTPLLAAVVLYFAAVLPLLGIDREYPCKIEEKAADDAEKEKHGRHFKVLDFRLLLPFFLFGLLIFFSPYMNLYFRNRYHMELQHIAVVVALVEVLPAVTNLLLMRLCKNVSMEKTVFFGCILAVLLYGLLAIINAPAVQVLLLLSTTVISAFLFPQISRLLLMRADKKKMGTVSGYANAFYNAGDAAGNYLEGLCIANGIYVIPFALAAVIYLTLGGLIWQGRRK